MIPKLTDTMSSPAATKGAELRCCPPPIVPTSDSLVLIGSTSVICADAQGGG